VTSVDGKAILVTGAARGIGAASAKRLAAAGARLSLVGLEPERLEETAAACGPGAVWFEADITDVPAIERAVAQTVERLGGLDVVIANAGLSGFGSVRTIDPAAFERTIEVNLLGVWRTIRVALPYVVARRGYVLPIASVAAALHLPLMAHYAATKAGVEAFADSLRGEVAHTGTKVGVAYFSFIDTDMVRISFEESAAKQLRENTPGPFRRVTPLPVAGRAIVRGVERRARKVYAPRWVPAMLALRGVMQPMLETQNREAIEEAVRVAEAEAASAESLAAPSAQE
jgi:NAD(P)-dependent dehydrogenase (short-subunit alcohol dehydrogenase family)